MLAKPKDVYQSYLSRYRIKLSKTERQLKKLSWYRLLVFVSGLILIYISASIDSFLALAVTILSFISLFAFLVKSHSKKLNEKKLYKAYCNNNEKEINALAGDIYQFENGAEYFEPGHQYALDLDIVGEGSLFQYLNRTVSVPGKNRLAKLLLNPIYETKRINRNQQLVEEFSFSHDWIQKFRAVGNANTENIDDEERIISWIKTPPIFNGLFYKANVWIIPFASLIIILLFSLQMIPYSLLLLYFLIPLGISGSVSSKTNARHNMVSKTSEMLQKYSLLIKLIEDFQPKTEELIKLKRQIINNNEKASISLKKLGSILTALDNRLNFVSWMLLNGLLLWDILQMIRLEKWQLKHKEDLKLWFDTIAEIDSLISLGIFSFNHPEFVFPEISNDDEILAKEMGHPLIPASQRVTNDFRQLPGEYIILTGANMAGKSTYLRTIGINLLLGMVGSVVCAKSFSFKPIHLHTSMRTDDSLNKNESYFYAELKRLKQIIDLLIEGHRMFVILDEILKGTNSKDKHSGSEALLKQLITYNSMGIVATHDVSLGRLAEAFPQRIKLNCFEVNIENGKLYFDYKMHEGVSKNLNATLLMRQMGITI